MKLEDLIKRIKAQINSRIDARNEFSKQLDELRETDGYDTAREADLLKQRGDVDAEIEVQRGRLETYEAELRSEQAIERLAAEVTPTNASPEARGVETPLVRVVEQRAYTRESDPKGERFLSDVVADFLNLRGDHSDRLNRHQREEQAERGAQLTRSVTAAGSPGLVVPQYLVDMYAVKGRPGRHFADQCRHHDLPETGMTVYIPRQVAATSVDVQTGELAAVSETDYDDELIPVPVRTAAGSQTLSRQVAERSLGTMDITFEDLMRSYDSDLDSKLVNSSTWGLLAVANAVTYTSAAPTGPELYSKIVGAQATAEDTLQNASEDDFFTLMRGRRWAWLKGQMTDQWPFILASGFTGVSVGKADGGYAAGVRGALPDGGNVVTDNNLPSNLGAGTNQDPVVVVARQEAHLWEDPAAPVFIRAEQTQAKKLGIDLVLYGYFAAIFDRVVDAQGTPKAVHQSITGTGLIAPTF